MFSLSWTREEALDKDESRVDAAPDEATLDESRDISKAALSCQWSSVPLHDTRRFLSFGGILMNVACETEARLNESPFYSQEKKNSVDRKDEVLVQKKAQTVTAMA